MDLALGNIFIKVQNLARCLAALLSAGTLAFVPIAVLGKLLELLLELVVELLLALVLVLLHQRLLARQSVEQVLTALALLRLDLRFLFRHFLVAHLFELRIVRAFSLGLNLQEALLVSLRLRLVARPLGTQLLFLDRIHAQFVVAKDLYLARFSFFDIFRALHKLLFLLQVS